MPSTLSNIDPHLNRHQRNVWEMVSIAPLRNLWNLQGVPIRTVAKRTWLAAFGDRLFGVAAELGFFFLFSLFPTLFCASSILGLAARSAPRIFDRLLQYLALVLPPSALGMVVNTFNQTTASSSSGKITFGLIAAIWSASVGISAVQETLNAVYKLQERRSYIEARIQAIGLTVVLIVTISASLASMFGGDFLAGWAHLRIHDPVLAGAATIAVRLCGWTLATALLALSFAVTYYWAPDLRTRRWHWFTPGAAVGMAAWLLASLGFRIYLHFFNTYSVTYGSLGAVIILLMWFYITGLMLLLGAEINSEIEAAAMEARIACEAHPPVPIAPAA